MERNEIRMAFPHSAEPVPGRREAPIRVLHAGYNASITAFEIAAVPSVPPRSNGLTVS
jgi:hypothetical protein